MFWGLIMEPNKRYTQTVESSFHVSMASLDLTTADEGVVQVMLCYANKNYLLCTLRKGSTWQVPLDLNFQEGTTIAFTCNGQGHVHLTGYLILEDMDELEDEHIEDEEDQIENLETLLTGKRTKRKALESPKNIKETKRMKQKIMESPDDDDEVEEIDEDDTEDSEDENDVQKEQEDDDDSDEVEMDEEEEEDEDDEDDEDEDEDENEKHEQKKKPTKPQLQQHEKKIKQGQQQKKQDKQKLLNGKETKQEQSNKQQKKNKANLQVQQQKESKKRVIEGGVQVEDIKVGNGTPAKSGKFVSVYYIGHLKNGKKFDSTTQGEGFKFRLGKGEVIKGWDVGLAGMKVGGKRRITVPPNMGYGAKGFPPQIPGNSTLIFDIELRNIH